MDFGSFHSRENYNGTLGNFHTKLTRFIFESQCYQLATPDLFKDEFLSVLPIQRNVSE